MSLIGWSIGPRELILRNMLCTARVHDVDCVRHQANSCFFDLSPGACVDCAGRLQVLVLRIVLRIAAAQGLRVSR
jgi:hypothetical protein